MVCKACTVTLREWTNGKRSLLMWLGATERTGTASSILIFNQHVVLWLIVMKFQCLSLENFLTLVTKMPPVLKDMKTKKNGSWRWCSTSIFPKGVEWSSSRPQLVNGFCQTVVIQIEGKTFLSDSARISFFRNRHLEYLRFFSTVKNLVYCADIAQLLLKLGVPQYEPKDWRLFIYSSKRSLKCVLLQAFDLVVKNFLGNNKARNYAELVNNMLTAFRNLGCNMSIKMYYLFSHMDRFPENLGSMSDEQGKRFHQDLKEMGTRYQGHWDAVTMADYFWNLKRDLPAAERSRSSKKRKFKPWSLNNGEATCNLRVVTFINPHYSVYSNRCFYQVINICCW